MGADEVIVIGGVDSERLDSRATADLLAAAIEKSGGFDLVICGEASIDQYAAQVGPRVAENLGIPQASHVRKATVGPDDCFVVEVERLEVIVDIEVEVEVNVVVCAADVMVPMA
jgi:electron transfer flavoprotein beta subunit